MTLFLVPCTPSLKPPEQEDPMAGFPGSRGGIAEEANGLGVGE